MGNLLIRMSAVAICSVVFGLGTMQAQSNSRGGIPAPNSRNSASVAPQPSNNRGTSNSGNKGAAAPNNRNNSASSNANRYNSNRNNSSNKASGGIAAPTRNPQSGVTRPQTPMTPDPRNKYDGGARQNGIARPNYVAGTPIPPPVRQYRPRTIVAPRPVLRPSNYSHSRRVEYINNVLGLRFYSGISVSLNYLYDNHYYIDGYNDNTIYLRDVNQLDYKWDDVYLNYKNDGLTSAQFIYSTSGDNQSRYNSVYYMLCARYGDPVMLNYNSRSPQGTAAWYGNDYMNYVTLDYYIDYAYNGQRRYYTVLTYCTNLDRNRIY